MADGATVYDVVAVSSGPMLEVSTGEVADVATVCNGEVSHGAA